MATTCKIKAVKPPSTAWLYNGFHLLEGDSHDIDDADLQDAAKRGMIDLPAGVKAEVKTESDAQKREASLERIKLIEQQKQANVKPAPHMEEKAAPKVGTDDGSGVSGQGRAGSR